MKKENMSQPKASFILYGVRDPKKYYVSTEPVGEIVEETYVKLIIISHEENMQEVKSERVWFSAASLPCVASRVFTGMEKKNGKNVAKNR